MNKFDSVIFDLDGTLLDTIDDLRTAVIYALESDEKTVTRQHILNSVNFGVRHLVQGVANAVGLTDANIDAAMERFVYMYGECYADKTVPYPGISEMLGKLRGLGYKIAVFSNKSDAFVKNLCSLKLADLVDAARGETDGVPTKPSPDGAYLVMKSLGTDDKKMVAYVGDSDTDVQTAKNAGFYCIGVSWGYRDEELLKKTGADAIAHSADELYELVTAVK